MSIYYVRHGETDYNKAYLIQGSIDAPLNEKGKEQAHQIALKLKDIKLDAIYCSPLLRARQTAEAINAFFGLPIAIAPELHEQRYGELEGNRGRRKLILGKGRASLSATQRGKATSTSPPASSPSSIGLKTRRRKAMSSSLPMGAYRG